MISTSASTDQPTIRIEGLVKRFGSFTALNRLDLEVARGEVHGFLGPSGAGKSTTIRVLLGLLRANAGTVELLGGNPWRDVVELLRRLAYVPGRPGSAELVAMARQPQGFSPAQPCPLRR